MNPWLSWSLIGFNPAVVVAALAVRGLRLRSVDAWQDYKDAGEAGEWLIPGLAILAGIALSKSGGFRPSCLALLTAAPLFAYATVYHLTSAAYWAARDRKRPPSVGRALVNYLRGLGSPLGITAYLLFSAWAAESHFVPPIGVRSFLALTVCSYLGCLIFNLGRSRTSYLPGKWRLLAPCELYSRVAEIAERIGVSVHEVRIVTEMPFRWAGGLARSSSGIVLTEDLLSGLTKAEVDAVVAHELGHAADPHYWWLYWPGTISAWLLWLAAACLIEMGIRALPAAFHSPNYLLWLSLFAVPKLAHNWYARRNERGANLWLRVLDNPGAAISGYRRLTVIDGLPTARPWWSRVLSTHPYTDEEIGRTARDAGLSDEEVAEAVRQGEGELPEEYIDRYEPAFHDECDRELLRRPKTPRKGDVGGWYGGLVICLVFGGLALATSMGNTIGVALAIAASAAGVIVIAVGLYIVIDRRRMARWRGFRDEARRALSGLYPSSASPDMILLDAIGAAEWDDGKWQCALVSALGGGFAILGELGDTRIAPAQVTGLCAWKSEGSQAEAGVALWYQEQGAALWVVLRPLGRPEKGEPRNLRELETRIRVQLASLGAVLPDRERLTVSRMRAIAFRVPAVAAIFAAIAFLTGAVAHLLRLDWGWAPYFLVLGTAGSALWSWVAAAGARKDRC